MGMLGTTGWINNVCLVEAQETNTKAEYLRCSIRENMSGIADLFFFLSFGHALSGGQPINSDGPLCTGTPGSRKRRAE